jgi:hypothetical protein
MTSEEIIRALPVDFVRRMRNWARAGAGVGIGALRAVDFEASYGDGYREAEIPTSEGEAADTQAALALVPARYRQAVEWFWSYEGNSLRWFGRKRNVHHETFAHWLCIGHDQLQAAMRMRSHAVMALAEANRSALAARNSLIAS